MDLVKISPLPVGMMWSFVSRESGKDPAEEAGSPPGPGACPTLLAPVMLGHPEGHQWCSLPATFSDSSQVVSWQVSQAPEQVQQYSFASFLQTARALGPVLLLVSLFLWHLGKLPHPAGYSHTFPSEAWVTTVIGEESTYYNVLLSVKLWHSPKDKCLPTDAILVFFRVLSRVL